MATFKFIPINDKFFSRIASPIKTFEELIDIILANYNPVAHKHGSFGGLRDAVHIFQNYMAMKTGKPWDFIVELLPKIQEWALKIELNLDVTLLTEGSNVKSSLTAEQVRFILANAFFGNIQLYEKAGKIHWLDMYTNDTQVSIHRIVCQLAYFNLAQTVDMSQIISFRRVQLADFPPPVWAESDQKIKTDNINIHTGIMEDSNATSFVDFANKRLHIHSIIPSATQEEVLFSCCPEAFPGILFCETLLDDEAIIISGCRRFSKYKGYLFTFEFTGDIDPPAHPPQDIIVIDAVCHNHFNKAFQLRDLNKIYLGFKPVENTKISTGMFGCGIFRGDKSHKFLQQVCVATVANVELDFSSFKEEATARHFRQILQKIQQADLRIKEAYNIMLGYNIVDRREVSFHDYLLNKLNKKYFELTAEDS
eukprot:TRINITY_DN6397_c0_g1_i3.p1 TRINITY_DN6397_c0_g1~~TRINITY_DN6397_c0_g1_i3.p1  ORF type:complete len:423 (+),score=64.11 TRINITY_DN6397_c0_g1_i3:350-1618(+)